MSGYKTLRCFGGMEMPFILDNEAEQDEVDRAEKELKGNLALSPLIFLHLKFFPPSQDSCGFSIFNAKVIENGIKDRKYLAFFSDSRANVLPFISTH